MPNLAKCAGKLGLLSWLSSYWENIHSTNPSPNWEKIESFIPPPYLVGKAGHPERKRSGTLSHLFDCHRLKCFYIFWVEIAIHGER